MNKIFNKSALSELKSEKYLFELPFPHIVIENLFNDDFLKKVLKSVLECNKESWWKYNNVFEKKFAFNNYQKMPVELKRYFDSVNSNYFVKKLEELTDIKDIISDPSLYGGGIHKIKKGGKLDIHEDFNFHKITGWKRKLNMITYLNLDWKEEYKGSTEFWNKNMTHCVKSIAPFYNRTVIFSVDSDSFHGHPDPLECPENVSRYSLATYYYTFNKKENLNLSYKSTRYKKRPGDKTDFSIEEMRVLRSQGRLKNETE